MRTTESIARVANGFCGHVGPATERGLARRSASEGVDADKPQAAQLAATK
jgi:hypothetical protein